MRAHALVDLDHLAVEQLGQHDVAVEDARPVLVGDAQLVAEAARDDEHRGLALALEQRVGRDRGAHLHRLDALHRDRLARRHAQQVADARDRRVAVLLGVFREQLVRDERAVGPARHDVGERAAAVDPELPSRLSCAHRAILTRTPLFASLPGHPHSRIPHEARLRPHRPLRFRVLRRRLRPDPSGTCPRPYARDQLPHREHRRSSSPTSTRPPPASSRSPCTRTRSLFKAQRDQARRAGRPGADRRDPHLGLLQRGPDLRRRFGAVPRHQLRGRREALEGLAQGDRGALRQAGHDGALHACRGRRRASTPPSPSIRSRT